MCKSSELRLLSWNADGVRNKLHELMDLAVSALCVDIISLCETRLTQKMQLNIPGFTCYRQDRHSTVRGQGVAILVKCNIEHSTVEIPPTKHIEATGIKISISGVSGANFGGLILVVPARQTRIING